MANAFGNDREVVSVLLFRAQSRPCALPIEHVVETMRPLPIEPIAGAPAAVKGLALIRGTPVPVVAIAALMADSDEPFNRFVTVKAGGYHVALAVDSVQGVHHLAAASLRELPPLMGTPDSNAVSAIGTADAELLLVLNAARIVPDDLLDILKNVGV